MTLPIFFSVSFYTIHHTDKIWVGFSRVGRILIFLRILCKKKNQEKDLKK